MNSQTAIANRSDSFINKVLSLFGISLLVTALGLWVGFQYMLPVFIANPIVMYALFGVELLLVFTSHLWAEKEPINKILFALFTFSSGLTIVPLIASFAVEFGGYAIIFNALFSTTVTFLAMGLIGWTSQRSFTGLSGFLFMALIGLIVVSIIGIFLPWGNTGEMIFSGIGILIFSAYAMIDIQRLRDSTDDNYVMASMRLYLNMFNLFVFMLRFIGANSRD